MRPRAPFGGCNTGRGPKQCAFVVSQKPCLKQFIHSYTGTAGVPVVALPLALQSVSGKPFPTLSKTGETAQFELSLP